MNTASFCRIGRIHLAIFRALGIAASAATICHPLAAAAEPAAEKKVFTLGEITVTATGENETSPLAPDTLDSEQLQDFSRDGLTESLNLIPGVSSTPGSGSRNEALISVRGFGRWQVPLLLDGIRVYLPADNRIDFDRFLTPDLAEIQVSKGYVSVLNGPDGMGGAINLVTRKPTKPFEADLRASAAFSNDGHYNGNTVYANLGTRQEMFYLQTGVEQRDVRGWYLSDNFKSTANEDGGKRDHTGKKDWRVNLKAGLTPNATDEYSLNFVKQEGEKHRAYSINEAAPTTVWDWPKWDVWSLYFLSHTKLGEKSYVKTRVHYNKFENDLVSSNAASPMNNNQNWTSAYDDDAYGASVEFGTDLLPGHTIKGSFFWRRDEHTEWNHSYPTSPDEPKQHTNEDVFSAALEETWHVTPKFDLVFGLSRDARFTRKAEEYASGVKFEQPTADKWATNYQAAAIWRYRDTGSAHFAISDRTRFPTMFERFSSRFGGAISNPRLKPERALNIELGIKDRIAPGLVGSVAIFHNKVDDAIQGVNVFYGGSWYSQSQNVGEATYKGVEFGLTATPADNLEIGANYAYIDTDIDNPNNPSDRLETTPRHKGFIYAKWQPLARLTVIPALELSDNRWSSSSVSSGYVKTGAYELLSLKLAYKLTPQWDVSFTARNLLDKNYAFSEGYPQEGRNFLVSTHFQF
ncbi:MAG: TonB-dependent receptor [Azoarcus sp.]|jgi:iron complex outermembrane receptor protein|nr:TonB-dependent receptor [Azoarcus sp.]